jgi:hypothetical protein
MEDVNVRYQFGIVILISDAVRPRSKSRSSVDVADLGRITRIYTFQDVVRRICLRWKVGWQQSPERCSQSNDTHVSVTHLTVSDQTINPFLRFVNSASSPNLDKESSLSSVLLSFLV